jgi:DNA-binding protein H-NS
MSKDAKVITFPSAKAADGFMLPKKSTLDTLSNQALCKLRDEIAEVLKSRAESLQREIDRLVGPASSASTDHRRGPRKGRKVAPKYQGPNGEKWSGRGLKPRWLTTAISKGKRLDDFLIDPPKNNHASGARHFRRRVLKAKRRSGASRSITTATMTSPRAARWLGFSIGALPSL